MGSRIGVETNLPPGWPGLIHREGRTLTRVTEIPDSNKKGPSSKSVGSVFHNPAMAGSRTRSVLLMAYAIESGMLGDSEVRACLLYTSPSPRDLSTSRMPSSA